MRFSRQRASVGFLAPLTSDEAAAYWRGVLAERQSGNRVLLIATTKGVKIAGSVQLAVSPKANGRHRAEVQKLLVHRRYRKRGLGRRLMAAIEDEAQQRQVSLLVLDTALGDLAEQLYLKLGYLRVGEIPNYARTPDGRLHPTAIFYKELAVA